MEIFKISESLGFSTNKNLDKDLNFYLLQKYLREKHLLHIEIYGFVSGDEQTRQYYHCIRNMKKYCDLTDDSETFDTYEECLESALQECLNIIKNNI